MDKERGRSANVDKVFPFVVLFCGILGFFFAFCNNYLVVFSLLLPKTEENKVKYMQKKDLKIFFKMSKCE